MRLTTPRSLRQGTRPLSTIYILVTAPADKPLPQRTIAQQVSAMARKRPTVAPTEGLLTEAVLKQRALGRTSAHDRKLPFRGILWTCEAAIDLATSKPQVAHGPSDIRPPESRNYATAKRPGSKSPRHDSRVSRAP
jgi:hypothetical protein